MESLKKQTEEMIARLADTPLPPEKVQELAATLIRAVGAASAGTGEPQAAVQPAQQEKPADADRR